MPQFSTQYLLWSALAALAGAALHVAILFAGPDWYAFFGAPKGLVQMARMGHPRAAISCLVIAALLLSWATYGLSGAGVIRRLPFLRSVLTLIAAVLILRGVSFVPLVLFRPELLATICDCTHLNIFILVTSALCLTMGIGYAVGAMNVGRQDRAV